MSTAQKTIFSFSRRPEKMIFPRKLHWNMIFLVLLGKMIFLFSKNMILFFRQIMKDDLSSNTWKYNIFFKSFQKRVFSKKFHWNMIFLVLSDDKRWYFSPKKHDIFSLDRKWKMIFLKKYMEIWYFLHIRTCVINMIPCPSAKKNQRWSFPKKMHLKVIDILDWHSRKSFNNSVYFYRDLCGRFHILLSSEKNSKLNI